MDSTTAAIVFNLLVMNYEARPGSQARWDSAPLYVLRHAIQHAADAGSVDDLLSDLEFVVNADPETLSSALALAQSPVSREIAAVYDMSLSRHRLAEPRTRRKILAVDAVRHGATSLVCPLATSGVLGDCDIVWARRLEVNAAAPVGPIRAAAYSTIDEQSVIVVSGSNGHIELWDADTSQLLQEWDIATNIDIVAFTEVDGRPLAVVGNGGAVWTWDLITGQRRSFATPNKRSAISAVECTTIAQRQVAVTGWSDGTVQLLDLHTFIPIGERVQCHVGPVGSVACGAIDGDPIAVTSGSDGMVHILGLRITGPMARNVSRLSSAATAMACTVVAGQAVVVLGRSDGVVEILDLSANEPFGDPLPRHASLVRSVACTEIGGRPLLCSGGDDRIVNVWDVTRPASTDKLPLPAEVSVLSAKPGGAMLVGFDTEVLALKFNQRTES